MADAAAPRVRRVQVGEHRVRLEERGPADAPAVLTVHGFIISQRYMVPLARRLAERFRVVAPDMPGYGRSSKPRDALPFDALADTLAALLDALGLPRAHVVGNSMGCQVALALAQRHPARVDRLVLLGPTTDRRARTVPQQAAALLRDMLRERASLPLIHVPDYLACGPRRFLQTLRHTMEDAPEARAPAVRAPTLVLRGERDALVSDAFAREIAGRLPRGELATLPGAPHAANYSAPDAAAEAISSFLLRPPAGTRR